MQQHRMDEAGENDHPLELIIHAQAVFSKNNGCLRHDVIACQKWTFFQWLQSHVWNEWRKAPQNEHQF